jgi:CheY-like chemotaxis protein
LSPCAVLVVDDDSSIRDIVSKMLELDGHQVETAEHGLEALQAVERSEPDLVLLDMRMPVMTGWEFAEAVKLRRSHFKIIVMTAAANAQKSAREIQADGCLSKPFGIDEVLTVVGQACANRSSAG